MYLELQEKLANMGFHKNIIQQVTKITNDLDKAVELAIQFNENNKMQIESEKNIQDQQCYQDEDYKMVFLVRKDLKIKLNTIAQEVATAALLAYKNLEKNVEQDQNNELILQGWIESGSKKIVVKVNDEKQLLEMIKKSLNNKIPAQIIYHQSHQNKEIPIKTPILAVLGPSTVDSLDQITKNLKLF